MRKITSVIITCILVIILNANLFAQSDTTCVKLNFNPNVGCVCDPDDNGNPELYACPITICIDYDISNCSTNECGLTNNSSYKICNTINGDNNSDFCFIDTTCIRECRIIVNSISFSRGVLGETLTVYGSTANNIVNSIVYGLNVEYCIGSFKFDCEGNELSPNIGGPNPCNPCFDLLCLLTINGVPTLILNP